MTRPFDQHLNHDEIDALVSPQGQSVSESGQGSGPALEEARRHVESCQYCNRMLQMHVSAQSEISRLVVPAHEPPGPDCSEEDVWLNIAAGIVEKARAMERMKHAAQCGHCGPLLKNAAEILAEEASPAEQEALSALDKTGREWQRSMHERLRVPPETERTQKRAWNWSTLFIRPAFAVAAIAVVVAAVWLGMRAIRPPDVEQLLAKAYTEHRTLEVRIGDARHAPVRVERGASGSSLDKPPSLLSAEAMIGEHLGKTPDDPVWLQARARADLLDRNYDSAIKSLQRALEAQPDSISLLTDLGSAYFVRAEYADRALDYSNAIESLSKALSKSPDDLIALFNRAIVCERMFLFTQAVDDWQHYLRLDPQGGWSDEARTHLAEVQQKIDQHQKSQSEPLLEPKEFSTASFEAEAAAVDQRVERYLDAAFQSWLPIAYLGQPSDATPTEARTSLERLAKIVQNNHDDTWLADFLQNPPSPIQNQALRALEAANDAWSSGRFAESITLARQSVRDFQRAGNQAGMLRATMALLFAQAFSLQYSDCLQTAGTSLPLLANTRYRWIQAQMMIEQGQCLGAVAELHDAIKTNQAGLELANRSHYPSLKLRAAAFGAIYHLDIDSTGQGLRELRDGLTTFWQSDVSNTRGQNLYAALSVFAETSNSPHLDAITLAEILTRFPSSDPSDRAVDRELLAGAQERAGDYAAAQKTLQTTTAQLASLPDDESVQLRRAEISLEDASIELHLGSASRAVATLTPLRKKFETGGSGEFQSEYFKTYGEAYLALGQEAAAQPLLQRALSVVETGLKSLHRETEKLSWSRSRSQLYRDLLQVKLKLQTPEEALAWWEWYKGASVRGSDSAGPSETIADLSAANKLPVSISPGTALISYALLGNSIVAFVFRDGVVQFHELPLPHDVEAQTLGLLDRCTDPTTDVAALNEESRRLYDILIAPLESDLQGAKALRIETDGILDQIPFTVLLGADGRYLGDKFEIAFSQGAAYGSGRNSESLAETLSRPNAALIVVASGSQDSTLAPLPEAADEGNEVASHFHQAVIVAGHEVSRADVIGKLRDAGIFHFAGHAVAGINRTGLLLGPDTLLSSRDLASHRPRNLKLAVLSACDTANGAEGTFADVNSIARTLAAAGVPEVVASRWKIDSAVTRQWMQAFYSTLLSGKTPADALRAASFTIRRFPGYQHPYYWASFALFGSS